MAIRFKFNAKKGGLSFENLSVLHRLREQKKSNKQFEVMLSNISLEELLAARLELASISMGGKFFNLPIWLSLNQVVRDALLKYVVSVAKSQREAAYFLGVTAAGLFKIFKKHGTTYWKIDGFDINRIRDDD